MLTRASCGGKHFTEGELYHWTHVQGRQWSTINDNGVEVVDCFPQSRSVHLWSGKTGEWKDAGRFIVLDYDDPDHYS